MLIYTEIIIITNIYFKQSLLDTLCTLLLNYCFQKPINSYAEKENYWVEIKMVFELRDDF